MLIICRRWSVVRNMFFAIIYALLLNYCVGHEYSVTCEDPDKLGLAVTPSGDAVEPRYQIRWCTNIVEGQYVNKWSITLHISQRDAANCTRYSIKDRIYSHSTLERDIKRSFDCNTICFSTLMDLMYDGCYTIKNDLRYNDTVRFDQVHMYYVHNNYTLDMFNQHETWFTANSNSDILMLKIHNKYIPLTDYYLKLCNEAETLCTYVQQNCTTISPFSAECFIPVESGRYTVLLSHAGPWVHGDVFSTGLKDVYYSVSHIPSSQLSSPPPRPASWTAAAAAAAAAVAAGLALCWWRRRSKVSWRDRVHRAWRERYANVRCEVKPGRCSILLLYARDTLHFNNAMAVLRDILAQEHEVWDLFSPSCVSALAGSPGGWLQDKLHGNTRVVFVQTATAAVLYGNNPNVGQGNGGGGGGGGGALLGRVVYARAQFGDALLQRALTHLLNAHTDYNKYYLASISAQPVEMFPLSVPFRRFPLPDGALCLLQALHIQPAPSVDSKLQLLAEHLSLHAKYVEEHPNYLQEELLMF